jgi:hypothetical protein
MLSSGSLTEIVRSPRFRATTEPDTSFDAFRRVGHDDPRAFLQPAERFLAGGVAARDRAFSVQMKRALDLGQNAMAGGGRLVDAGLGGNGARHALDGRRLLRRRLGDPDRIDGQQCGEADRFHERLLHVHVALTG